MPSSCHACKKAITLRNLPGIACAGCKKSFHFTCAEIKQADQHLYSDTSNPKVFVCASCFKEYRRNSLSLASEESAKSTLTSSTSINKKPADRRTSNNSSTTPTITTTSKSALESALLMQVQELQKLVSILCEQVKEARKEIAELKSSNPISNQSPQRSNTVSYTINGIGSKEGENVNEIVSKVISAKKEGFAVDESIKIKRLPSKSDRHHSILITVQRDSTQHEALKSSRGSSIRGSDLGFDCERIYVNESHSPDSYKLFKKAKELKTKKNFKAVWISQSRVYAREGERDASDVIWIKSDSALLQLLE